MWKWLLRKVEYTATMEKIEALELEVARLRTHNKAFELELREFVLSKLEPLSKRLQTKMTREAAKEEEEKNKLEKQKPFKPGLISPSEYYGTDSRST